MGNYVAQNLGPNEKVVYRARINKLAIIPNIIGIVFGIALFFILDSSVKTLNDYMVSLGEEAMPEEASIIITVMFLFISLVIIIANTAALLSIINMELVITNKRVLGKVGVLSIKALDYPIEKIDNVSLNAGLFGRIFNYYNLSVKTAGTSAVNPKTGAAGGINFIGVENAIEFKNHDTIAIEQHAAEARKQQAEEIARAMMQGQQK